MDHEPDVTRRLSPEEAHLAVQVARRYFIDDRSKVDIADELGLSRFKVARLLDRARAERLVKISISLPDDLDGTLSRSLADKLGIARVLVADVGGSRSVLDAVGTLAATYLRGIVTSESLVGIAWSRAARALSEHVADFPPCSFLQLCGVMTQPGIEEHNVEIVRSAAKSCHGRAITFYAPLVLPDAATAATLRSQRGIEQALSLGDDLTVAVIATGHWKPGSSSVFDALEHTETEALASRGAVGESCGLLFDASGAVLRNGLQDRLVAVNEKQLRGANEVVALATEADRTDAIRAITRSGLVDTLVTHSAVAARLLQG